MPDFVSHWGTHQPSREDCLSAPFYPDPSQRVFAVEFQVCILVTKIEKLLRLAQERKGEDLRWEEWRAYAIRVSRGWEDTGRLWVSDHLLFCVSPTRSGETVMDVYDFSARASVTHTKTVEGWMAERFEPSVSQILPWGTNETVASCGCHGSITFVLSKVRRSLNPTRN